jgi:hypothetical protein
MMGKQLSQWLLMALLKLALRRSFLFRCSGVASIEIQSSISENFSDVLGMGILLGGVCSDADSKLLLALLACERSRSFSAARWPQPLSASSSVWRRLKYGESAVCYQAASIFPL